ncbi:hypothetical protein [Pedobacter foliorum]|uniref:hypothetical protein n=1 Tax=Pedobacter foliorum TaxID=2739058 RepID=UPI0015630ED1|nr:hypothetical protein [Pedobacter foliorum]NRF38478.1 hypothetical protein [Pedobacter foliorum]
MALKSIVDELLKEEGRSMTWLSVEMGKTFDGLKLSLTRGSIKYNDIIAMAKVLEVPPATFFQTEVTPYNNKTAQSLVGDQKGEYADLKNNLKNCKEMLTTLKDQIKDKDKIISLLSKED